MEMITGALLLMGITGTLLGVIIALFARFFKTDRGIVQKITLRECNIHIIIVIAHHAVVVLAVGERLQQKLDDQASEHKNYSRGNKLPRYRNTCIGKLS